MIPSKPTIILISGKAGVGKTTSALMIEDLIKEDSWKKLGKVKTYHFAGGVKQAARESFGWDGKKDEKGRTLLQRVGQAGREYDEDIWALQLVESVLDDALSISTALVDDWRFPNEVDIVFDELQFNLFTCRIYAPEREILKGTPAYDEISETSLSDKPEDYDFFLDNSGSFEELRNSLEYCLDHITNTIDFYG